MSEPQSILDSIRTRRSIRRYQDRPVQREMLDALLEAARWAPSAHNRQPWRFAILESREAKEALAAAMGQRLRADLERDGVAPELIEADAGRSFARITSAPVVIVLCITMRDMDRYADERRQQAERIMAIQSAAMAGQNLLLAASSNGLGACWMCAPLFVPEIVRETLALESDWEPQALITLGYPAESKTRTRRDLSSLVQFIEVARAKGSRA